MPKLYEYFGVLVMFYSNEHKPVHVHGKFQGRESRAELILVDGLVTEIRAWLDPDRFPTFRLEYGELVWGDYELCFPMIDLYRNKIDHRSSLEAVA